MNSNHNKEDSLYRNLQDAGCSPSSITQFMKEYGEKNWSCQLHILDQQRTTILESLHEQQNRLDCLDYLLFQIKKEAEPLHGWSRQNRNTILGSKTVKETDHE